MVVESEKDIEGLKRIGQIVAATIQEMKKMARIGMTTQELDEIGGAFLRQQGAVSAPKTLYRFPGYTCISVNQEIAHGIPGSRKLKAGDLVNIDVSAELNGYYGDTGHSFQLPPYDPRITALCDYTYRTMMTVIQSLKDGVKVNEIGRLIEQQAAAGGYSVIKNLCSHGIGRALHEPPQEIWPTYNKHDKRVLRNGLVITIEPFLTTGADFVVERPDGWTLALPDHSYGAQHEHTIIITKDQPIILTVA